MSSWYASFRILVLGLLLLASCNGGSSSSEEVGGQAGRKLFKPGTDETFFGDTHQNGRAARMRVHSMSWGRLVDVYDVDADGNPNKAPIYEDFVVGDSFLSTDPRFDLDIHPITQEARLIIQRTEDAPDTGNGTFDSILRQVSSNLPPIVPKHDNGTSPGPFSFLPRNSCLVIRFDDVLRDTPAVERMLKELVRLRVGYPPVAPFTARYFFDRNHGGIVDGAFHATRVLVDLTVSEADLLAMVVPEPINSLGLPSSDEGTSQPNVSVRFPTALSPIDGQHFLLENLSGNPLATTSHGPVDLTTATRDVVRAMRAGGPHDINNGFLLDIEAPAVLGSWPVSITTSSIDPAGEAGFEFVTDIAFASVCQRRPDVGDILSVGGGFYEVTQLAGLPDPVTGFVGDVRLRTLDSTPVGSPSQLLGSGSYLSTFDPAVGVQGGCWLGFLPLPGSFPATDVLPEAQITVRFSEPLDPVSVKPFDTFLVIEGAPIATVDLATASTIRVARVGTSSDLREFTFLPVLPFAHAGESRSYHVRLDGSVAGVTDLAGNALADALPEIEFRIDPTAPPISNASVALRFNEVDEYRPEEDKNDLRGQLFYDFERGVIRPRPVAHSAEPVDRSNPVPALMPQFPPGVQTPLSPLGSKLQHIWRYCDLGWLVDDESRYNIDVEGLSWAPVGSLVISDFYEDFEIRLAHSSRLPDEYLGMLQGPAYANSGLYEIRPFDENILQDPRSPQAVVHNRALGYRLNPADAFVGSSGTTFLPYPLNRVGAPKRTYLWRDTAVQAVGGEMGAGVPMHVEAGPPLSLYGVGTAPGFLYPVDKVPSIGLPLLIEIRCYPSNTGIGLNAFSIGLGTNSSPKPNFRAFSTGGLNTGGVRIVKDPDLETTPSGGFNPSSSPPGMPTMWVADNSMYFGQLEYAVRVSRVHSAWLDSGMSQPNWYAPILEPLPFDQPPGTSVVVEYRGAVGFDGVAAGNPQFDASELDPYGNLDLGTAVYLEDEDTWWGSIDQVDSARYVQLRISMTSDIVGGIRPELSAIGIVWEAGP